VPKSLDLVINQNIFTILKPYGRFIFDEPNKQIINYFVLLISKADPTGEERPLNPKRVLTDKSHKVCLETIDYYGLMGPLVSWIFPKLINKAEKIDLFLENSILKVLLLRWIIIGSKKG